MALIQLHFPLYSDLASETLKEALTAPWRINAAVLLTEINPKRPGMPLITPEEINKSNLILDDLRHIMLKS